MLQIRFLACVRTSVRPSLRWRLTLTVTRVRAANIVRRPFIVTLAVLLRLINRCLIINIIIIIDVGRGSKPGAKDLKPPDLWIHDRVGQRRTSHASNSAVSSAGAAPSVAGSGSQDVNDDSC